MSRLIPVLLLAMLAALLVPATAMAGGGLSFVVDDAGDARVDSPTGCAELGAGDAGGTCTLREAIADANALGDPGEGDLITFDLAAGTTIRLQPILQSDGDDLDITASMTIDGGGEITVSAADLRPGTTPDAVATRGETVGVSRVFDVLTPDDVRAMVELRGLTIRDGSVDGTEEQEGGGIRAQGQCVDGHPLLQLHLREVLITDNVVGPTDSEARLAGGGVYVSATDLTVSDSTITRNAAYVGGGIAAASRCEVERLQIDGSTIAHNAIVVPPVSTGSTRGPGFSSAEYAGAGIHSAYAETTLAGSVIADNHGSIDPPLLGAGDLPVATMDATSGGGLMATPLFGYWNGTSTGEQDSAKQRLGPPYGSSLDIEQTWFTGNRSSDEGGGLWTSAPVTGIDSSTFSGNTTAGWGGGILNSGSQMQVVNSTLTGNEAGAGAAIFADVNRGSYGQSDRGRDTRCCDVSPTLLTYVTVADNLVSQTSTRRARGLVGGSLTAVSTPDGNSNFGFTHSILQSATSEGPTCVLDPDSGALSDGGNSNDDATCVDATEDRNDVIATQDLAALADNEGPAVGTTPQEVLPTMALVPGTEAIDALVPMSPTAGGDTRGRDACTGSSPVFAGVSPLVGADQRGVERPQDGDDDGTALCDRGAYEHVFVPTPPAPSGEGPVDVMTTKTGPDEVAVGDSAQFTITLSNRLNRADNVILRDTIPSGLRLDGASDPCTIDGQSVRCAVGSINSVETVVLTIDVTAVSEGTFTNTACATNNLTDLDSSNDCDAHTITVGGLDTAERVEGPERITTSVAASQATFEDGAAGAVVLTRADDFPDAQAGTPLAIARDAALLLTQSEVLSDASEEEILRVLPTGGDVYILGGTTAIGVGAEARLVELGYNVIRLGGSNRYATAVTIAAELDDPGTLLMADGGDFPAAVVAGAAGVVAGDSDFAQAGRVGAAVLLTSGDAIPAETQAYLDGRGDTPNLIPIGDGAASALPEEADAITGADRFELSVAVADAFFDAPSAVGVATGENFADALTGGALVGRPSVGPGPILLSAADALPTTVAGYVEANVGSITRLLIFGGTTAIQPAVEDDLNAILGTPA